MANKLTEEEKKAILESIERFGKKTISQYAGEMDERKRISKEVIRAMADLSLLGICVSEEYGGVEFDFTTAAQIGGAIAKEDETCSIPVAYLLNTAWPYVLQKYGTEEAKKELLPRICRGEILLGIASTEVTGGSDLQSMRMTIEKKDGKILVNGEKMFISLVGEIMEGSGGFITLAKQKDGNGMTLFYLPLAEGGVLNPGITARTEKEIGRDRVSCGGFNLQNVEIPEKYILGNYREGLKYVHLGYEGARLIICMVALDAATKVLDDVTAYLSERYAFGEPLLKRGAIQYELIEHYIELEAARSLALEALKMFDENQKEEKYKKTELSAKIAMAKKKATLSSFNAVVKAMILYGAPSFIKETTTWKTMLGLLSFLVGAEGGLGIMNVIAAKELFGKEFIDYKK